MQCLDGEQEPVELNGVSNYSETGTSYRASFVVVGLVARLGVYFQGDVTTRLQIWQALQARAGQEQQRRRRQTNAETAVGRRRVDK